MALPSSSDRLGAAVRQAIVHWQTAREQEGAEGPAKAKTPTKFTIAISREAGALGSTIAHRVGEILGWPVYDRELLKRIADEKGLRVQLLESVDEKHTNWLSQCLAGFVTSAHVSEEAFVRYLVESLLSLSTLGDCVIVGRGAAQILPASSTFRVRLIGPEKDRVEYVTKKFALPPEEAARWVKQTDQERKAFVKQYFHKNPEDLDSYDLIINTARVSAEAAAQIIVEGLKGVKPH